MTKLKVFSFILLFLLLAGCLNPEPEDVNKSKTLEPKPVDDSDFSVYSNAIEIKLNSAGINVTKVEVKEDVIEVYFIQPSSSDIEEVYSVWSYIFGVAVNNAPSGNALKGNNRIVSLFCSFDDGEQIKVTSGFKEILSFLNEETNTWNFIYSWETESLTKGPQIPE